MLKQAFSTLRWNFSALCYYRETEPETDL